MLCVYFSLTPDQMSKVYFALFMSADYNRGIMVHSFHFHPIKGMGLGLIMRSLEGHTNEY